MTNHNNPEKQYALFNAAGRIEEEELGKFDGDYKLALSALAFKVAVLEEREQEKEAGGSNGD